MSCLKTFYVLRGGDTFASDAAWCSWWGTVLETRTPTESFLLRQSQNWQQQHVSKIMFQRSPGLSVYSALKERAAGVQTWDHYDWIDIFFLLRKLRSQSTIAVLRAACRANRRNASSSFAVSLGAIVVIGLNGSRHLTGNMMHVLAIKPCCVKLGSNLTVWWTLG